MEEFYSRFVMDLKGRGYVQGSQDHYLANLQRFFKWIEKIPANVTPDDVRRYQIMMIDQKLDPQTVNLRTAALRFFFLTTLKKGWPTDFVPYMKRIKKQPMMNWLEKNRRLLIFLFE